MDQDSIPLFLCQFRRERGRGERGSEEARRDWLPGEAAGLGRAARRLQRQPGPGRRTRGSHPG